MPRPGLERRRRTCSPARDGPRATKMLSDGSSARTLGSGRRMPSQKCGTALNARLCEPRAVRRAAPQGNSAGGASGVNHVSVIAGQAQ